MFSSLPVLMYHSVSRFSNRFAVSPELFEEHCATLAKAGWRGIALEEAEAFFLKKRSLPKKTCLFTFDDGFFDTYVYAEPILRHFGHHGALFPVANLLEERDCLRPTLEAAGGIQGVKQVYPSLDERPAISRSGLLVDGISFCSWREVLHMQQNGNLSAAPHSLGHTKVLRNLNFTELYTAEKAQDYFDIPPYTIPLGFPCFELGWGFVYPGYTVAPELFKLIYAMVPQEVAAARAFLANPKNTQAVHAAIAALPSLGVQESEAQYRARIAADFAACREIFTAKLGKPPISFCWPWGKYSSIALEEGQKAGFQIFFTTGRGVNLASNASQVHRITVHTMSGKELVRKVTCAASPLQEFLRCTIARLCKVSRKLVSPA